MKFPSGAKHAPVRTEMPEVPFVHRLSTRLTLLILAVVAVLAGAALILIFRGFDLAEAGLATVVEGGVDGEEINSILQSTVINMVAVLLFTLVAAAVFSRGLLIEPIRNLTRATRELAEGNLGVTLPVTSRSELGVLAQTFNLMSQRLADRTRELTETNAALQLSEERNRETLALLERRVQERTAELAALLELSNSTALTLELHPMLARILTKLDEAIDLAGAQVLGRTTPGSDLEVLAVLGELPELDHELPDPAALTAATLLSEGMLAVPLTVRETNVGMLLLAAPAGRSFPPERRRLAEAFANQVAVALENHRLTEQVLERAAAEQRQHLARELHDSVSQALYGILLGTHAVQRQLRASPDAAASALAYVENLAEAGLAEMRALIFELRPESLEEDGLAGALRKQLDALESRHGLETSYRAQGEPDLPLSMKQVLFRIAQEATHNVVKHAAASHVEVTLVWDESSLRLEIRDDGKGFDPTTDYPGHLGLRSMAERVEGLGGDFIIDSRAGHGTTVRVTLPMSAPVGRRRTS